jgi:hypothetical protein
MSVRWTRSSQIANGKYLEAIGWAKETSAYVEKKWNTPSVSVWLDSFGQMGTMRWSIDFPDLASVEKVQTQMLADQGYWQLVDKAFKNGLFIDNTTQDTISRQV